MVILIPLFWIGFYRASDEPTLIKVGEKAETTIFKLCGSQSLAPRWWRDEGFNSLKKAMGSDK